MDNPTILALCAGIGGLELGIRLAIPRARVVGYVEREAFAASVLLARMEDKALEPAPVWCGNLEQLDASVFAGVDIVTAGFPCQPFSQAGKRRYEADTRWLWPNIARVIGQVGASCVFLENVTRRAFSRPVADLEAAGLMVHGPIPATAAGLGAGHIRRRFFLLAHDSGFCGWPGWLKALQPAEVSSNPVRQGQPQPGRGITTERGRHSDSTWWESEPGLDRVVYGVPYAMDRLRVLGNGVVPLVAAHAFRILATRAFERHGQTA